MEAGRTLDAEIARKLFRLVVIVEPQSGTTSLFDMATKQSRELPHFSTNSNEAYSIIQHYHNKGYTVQVKSDILDGAPYYDVIFVGHNIQPIGYRDSTLAAAICNAGLTLHESLKP